MEGDGREGGRVAEQQAGEPLGPHPQEAMLEAEGWGGLQMMVVVVGGGYVTLQEHISGTVGGESGKGCSEREGDERRGMERERKRMH